MRSTVTVAASVLATHYVDLTSADAEARVAERLRDTGLIIFDGLAGRRTLLAFATRIMAMTPHRDSDSDGLTTIHDIPGTCGRAGYAGFGREELLAHTEGSSLPDPPRLMLLACQRPADQGGECLLADGRAVHADLSTGWHEAAVMLSRPRTVFFGAGDGHCTQVFTVHPGGRVTLRLRQDELARWSPLAAPHLPTLREVITRHQFRLPLAPGQGYLLDNHRWLHARTQFTGDRSCLRALGEPRTSLVGGFAISPAAALVPVTSEAALMRHPKTELGGLRERMRHL